MLGVSGLLGSSGDGAAAAAAAPSGPPDGGGGLGGSNSGGGGFSEDDKAAVRGEEADRSSAGNRWPRQETLALLKIRSDMDVVFRDSSLKGPLWDEVSRKLAELGYQRSSKKCKEKFENVYKYHKRTKEGRASKPDAKTYRFFDQLEALDNHPIPNIPSLGPPPPTATAPLPALPPPLRQQLHHHQPKSQPPAASAAAPPPPPMLPAATTTQPLPLQQITVPSAAPNMPTANNSASQNTPASTPTAMTISPSSLNPSPQPPQTALQQPRNPTNIPQPPSMLNPSSQAHSFRNLQVSNSTSSSSSTSSDETLDGNDGDGGGGRGRKRKRKWKDFFERLMRDVIKKQEELQKRFLEAIEKRERDRMVREEAWRMQEMARMNREHEILVKERSIAATKDAALIAFLQKMSSDPQNPVQVPPVPEDAAAVALQVVSPPPPQPPTQAQSQPPAQQAQSQPQTPLAAAQQPQPPPPQATSPTNFGTIVRVNSNSIVAVGGGLEGVNVTSPPSSTSSSRWPKTEVQALIKLRTDLDVKYQESGPKGPLWEEISAGMRQLGYTRNAKRCKEKWENINKYFKKVKESNKKRPEDSKTCPYFHQLDALYREKTLMRTDGGSSNNPIPNYVPMLKPPGAVVVGGSSGQATVVSPVLPMMVRPEQQWPLHPEDQRQPPEDIGSENMELNPEDDMDDDDDDGDDGDDDDEDDEEGGGYEIVTNKQKTAAGGES